MSITSMRQGKCKTCKTRWIFEELCGRKVVSVDVDLCKCPVCDTKLTGTNCQSKLKVRRAIVHMNARGTEQTLYECSD